MAGRTLTRLQGWTPPHGHLPMGVNSRLGHEFRLGHGRKYKYHPDQGSRKAAATSSPDTGNPNCQAHTGARARHSSTPGAIRKVAAHAGRGTKTHCPLTARRRWTIARSDEYE